ncbi:hypothetical protein [Streptomyces sp. NPDC005209]|uniref:hypothetical protein n=1 Tax=Streptomyces sp. NPDC005209 TaxID=3156715 RepID=UPI0033BDDDDB
MLDEVEKPVTGRDRWSTGWSKINCASAEAVAAVVWMDVRRRIQHGIRDAGRVDLVHRRERLAAWR